MSKFHPLADKLFYGNYNKKDYDRIIREWENKLLINERRARNKEYRGELMEVQRSKNKVLKFNIKRVKSQCAHDIKEICKHTDYRNEKDVVDLICGISGLINKWCS